MDIAVDILNKTVTTINKTVKLKGQWDSLSSVYQEKENVVRSTVS
jgi:hypothetical protein